MIGTHMTKLVVARAALTDLARKPRPRLVGPGARRGRAFSDRQLITPLREYSRFNRHARYDQLT